MDNQDDKDDKDNNQDLTNPIPLSHDINISNSLVKRSSASSNNTNTSIGINNKDKKKKGDANINASTTNSNPNSIPSPLLQSVASPNIPIKGKNKGQEQQLHSRNSSQSGASINIISSSPKDTISISGSIGDRTVMTAQSKLDNKKAPKGNQQQNSSSQANANNSHQGRGSRNDTKQVGLFSHLPEKKYLQDLSTKIGFSSVETIKIHPAILSLGLKYNEGSITGATARTIAMLQAFLEVLQDYKPSKNKVFSTDFDKELKPQIQFLVDSRPLCIAMGNAIKYFKSAIQKISSDTSEDEAKSQLAFVIEDYIRTHILNAQEELMKIGCSRISNGDVIMTYARSSVVEKILINAATVEKKKFKVIVAGSRPTDESIKLVHALATAGIECVFVLLPCISFSFAQITHVFLGAGAVLSNGGIISRAGTASVALMAREFQKPVYVFAETYKFSGNVQLDSITSNELADPDKLLINGTSDPLAKWRETPNLKLLNLVYDMTPADLIRCIVTEVGIIPPTSVPVIVRERKEIESAE